MADIRNYLQMAQAGGSPYDEDQSMPIPPMSTVNSILNQRMAPRIPYGMGRMLDARGYPGFPDGPADAPTNAGRFGSDNDMLMMYGPEDQVAYDDAGRPIPLNDPRHPMNSRGVPNLQGQGGQVQNLLNGYPQQRR